MSGPISQLGLPRADSGLMFWTPYTGAQKPPHNASCLVSGYDENNPEKERFYERATFWDGLTNPDVPEGFYDDEGDIFHPPTDYAVIRLLP